MITDENNVKNSISFNTKTMAWIKLCFLALFHLKYVGVHEIEWACYWYRVSMHSTKESRYTYSIQVGGGCNLKQHHRSCLQCRSRLPLQSGSKVVSNKVNYLGLKKSRGGVPELEQCV